MIAQPIILEVVDFQEECKVTSITTPAHQSILHPSLNWRKIATEPWRFVIFEKENLAKFSSYHALLYKQETSKDKYKQKKFDKTLCRTEKVSHVIAIVMKRGKNAKIPVCEEHAATAIAVQNIWLGATAKGIACYWGSGGMTYHPMMKSFLGFEEQDEVMGFLYLGYSDDEWPKGRRLSEIDDKVKYFEH